MNSHHEFVHRLPFGAEVERDGVRFRIWAPQVDRMSIHLVDRDLTIPMQAEAEGWFVLETPDAGPGDAYFYELPNGMRVPDPASRCQRDDVHGPSLVIEPRMYSWKHGDWRGRPWHESVLYELHIGAFTSGGTFADVERRLDGLAHLGVTAVELMPIADFPGNHNWGYDGVLPYAPDRAYGSPDELKALVDAAHGRGLMMFLDVVYNHFGPDGNYLHVYAADVFTNRHETPWGAAVDFTRPQVRDFFVENAIYWLEEYRFDGLRFDAVHAILDDSERHFLEELAERVRAAIPKERHVHLVLENDDNTASLLDPGPEPARRLFTAQWNDDFHHAAHVLATGETGGYYGDYAERPLGHLGRCLTTGFAYQGEPSPHRSGVARGERSGHLVPTRFVSFVQNHDQVGNRAFGERLDALAPREAVEALLAVMLPAPSIPMLFMGEEDAAQAPFLYFCDFHDELADAVREGRRREFASFPEFADPEARERIPDPNAGETFRRTWLAPDHRDREARERRRTLIGHLLDVRRREVMPLIAEAPGGVELEETGESGMIVRWRFPKGTLCLVANLHSTPLMAPTCPPGRLLAEVPTSATVHQPGMLPPWSAVWYLDDGQPS